MRQVFSCLSRTSMDWSGDSTPYFSNNVSRRFCLKSSLSKYSSVPNLVMLVFRCFILKDSDWKMMGVPCWSKHTSSFLVRVQVLLPQLSLGMILFSRSLDFLIRWNSVPQ